MQVTQQPEPHGPEGPSQCAVRTEKANTNSPLHSGNCTMASCAGAEQVRSKALCQTPRYTSIKSYMPLANFFSNEMIGAIGLVKAA